MEYCLGGGGYFPDDYFGKLLPRHEVEWTKLGSNVCYLLVLSLPLSGDKL